MLRAGFGRPSCHAAPPDEIGGRGRAGAMATTTADQVLIERSGARQRCGAAACQLRHLPRPGDRPHPPLLRRAGAHRRRGIVHRPQPLAAGHRIHTRAVPEGLRRRPPADPGDRHDADLCRSARSAIFNVTFGLILALLTTAISRASGSFFRGVWLLPRMSPSVLYILLWLWVVDPVQHGPAQPDPDERLRPGRAARSARPRRRSR